MAVHGTEIDQAQRERRELAPEVQASVDSMRADYEAQLDARYAAARGLRGCHRHARGDPRPARLRCSGSPPTTPGRISAPSCSRRSTRPPPARTRMRPSRPVASCLAARRRARLCLQPVARRRVRPRRRAGGRAPHSAPRRDPGRRRRATRGARPAPRSRRARRRRFGAATWRRRRWRTPTAGCRSRAPAWIDSFAPHPELRRPRRADRHSGHRHRSGRARASSPRRPAARRSSTCATSPARARSPLARVTPAGDSVEIGGRRLGGFGRVAALNTAGPYYAGTIAELPLGAPPASDLNGNGAVRDTLPIVVVRATDGWVLFADTDGDGSLAGERPVHDYLAGRETLRLGAQGRPSPTVNVAANFADAADAPTLDLFFDTGGARHPRLRHRRGSRPLRRAGLRRRGARRAAPRPQDRQQRAGRHHDHRQHAPGNGLRHPLRRGAAPAAGAQHELRRGQRDRRPGADRSASSTRCSRRIPDVVFTISAGNDGPGLSTIGFPGSASRAISVGATLPSSFLPPGPSGAPLARPARVLQLARRRGRPARPGDARAWPTARCRSGTPGDEVEQGTSMASPHAAGLAALLDSAASRRRGVPSSARDDPAGAHGDRAAHRRAPRSSTRAPGSPMSTAPGAGSTAAPTVAEVEVRAVGPGRRHRRGAPRSGRPAATPCRASSWFARRAAPPRPTRSEATRPGSPRRRRSRSRPARTTLAAQGRPTDDRRPGRRGRDHHRMERRYARRPRLPAGRHGDRRGAGGPGHAEAPREGRAARRRHAPDLLPGRQRAPVRAHRRDQRPGRARARRFCTSPTACRSATRAPGRRASARRPPSTRPTRATWYRAPTSRSSWRRPTQPLSASVSVSQSPLALRAARAGRVGARELHQRHQRAPVDAEVGMHLGGAARIETVTADRLGSRSGFPSSCRHGRRGVVVDITMDRAQWGRFTDFGVTLFDSLGQQLGKQPLNYAFGRLQVELPEGHGDMPGDARPLPRLRRSRPATSGGASAPRSGSMPTHRSCWPAPIPAPQTHRAARHGHGRLRASRLALAARPQVRSARAAGGARGRPELDPRDRAAAARARRSSRDGAAAAPSGSPPGRGSGATGSRRRSARCAAARSTT